MTRVDGAHLIFKLFIQTLKLNSINSFYIERPALLFIPVGSRSSVFIFE